LRLACYACPTFYGIAQIQITFEVCVSKMSERIPERLGN
jgi:hypothetical protein